MYILFIKKILHYHFKEKESHVCKVLEFKAKFSATFRMKSSEPVSTKHNDLIQNTPPYSKS